MFPRGFPTPVAPEKHCAHSWAQSSKHAAAQTASVVTKSSKSQYCVVDSASILYICIYTMCYHIVRVWTTSQFMAILCSDLLVRLDFHPTAIVQLPRLFWDETTSVAGCQMTKRLISPKAKPYGSVKYLIISHYEYILGISWEGPFPWCHITHLAPIDYAETAVQPWSCVAEAEWESNMAMEDPPLIADFPILTSIYKGFPSQPCLITRG